MKILLTGANGFLGSHILDRLLAAKRPVSVLLRRSSDTRFIAGHLSNLDVRYGSLADADSLERAVRGADSVVHCAGKTKAVRAAEYYDVNERGTRNLLRAIGASKGAVRRLVHVSSLAAGRPGDAEAPALESDAPCPVSHYGRSKLRGEQAVREMCEAPYTILRPAAVYGPRDADFLSAFKAVRRHVMPLIGGGRMPLSLAYVGDVADATIRCLDEPAARGRTYHVASPRLCTTREFLTELAAVMQARTLKLPLPLAALYPLCLAHEILGRLTGTPHILSRQKLAEMAAPGWVCSTEAIRRDLGFAADTPLAEGIARTVEWYEKNGWL